MPKRQLLSVLKCLNLQNGELGAPTSFSCVSPQSEDDLPSTQTIIFFPVVPEMDAHIFQKRYSSQAFRHSHFSPLGKEAELNGRHDTCVRKLLVTELTEALALYPIIWLFTSDQTAETLVAAA